MVRAVKKILLVEDDNDIRQVAGMALGTVGGFNLKACASGAEALDQIVAFKPDVILLDVMMPKMDGPTVYSKLRGIPGFEKTPVIFMTAKTQAAEMEEYLKLGALGVIKKPFDPMALPKQIRELVEGDAS